MRTINELTAEKVSQKTDSPLLWIIWIRPKEMCGFLISLLYFPGDKWLTFICINIVVSHRWEFGAMRVLLVEDDANTAQSIELILKSEGYIVDTTDLGEDGLEIGKLYDYDIIILDLMLPDIDGYEVLRRLRSSRVNTPILILSGLSELDNKIKGLGFGADDYLTKPFDRRELLARIQAIVRRSKGHSESVIKTGKLTVNLDTRTVEVESQPLHLTGKEYGILELLSLRKGTTLTKEMFLNHLYGGMDEPELKIIDVFVCKLRKKLSNATGGENYIETVWGRGYVLRDPEEARGGAKKAEGASA
jgi:two-component system cell cycle response regulator CtrA